MSSKIVIKKTIFTLEEFKKTLFMKDGVCLITIFHAKKYDDRGVPLYTMYEISPYKDGEIKIRGLYEMPIDAGYFKDVYTSVETAYTITNAHIMDSKKNPNTVVTVSTR